MTTTRRQLLRVGGLSLAGGVVFASTGSRTAMAVDAEAAGTTISNDDGNVSALTVPKDGLDTTFSWRGIENATESVDVTLGVRLAGETNFDTIATGEVDLGGKSNGEVNGSTAISWDDEGDISLLGDDPFADDAFDVGTPESSETFTLEFDLAFEHSEASAETTAEATIEVVNSGSAVPDTVIDGFESASTGTLPSPWVDTGASSPTVESTGTPWGSKAVIAKTKGMSSGQETIFYTEVPEENAGPVETLQFCAYEPTHVYMNGVHLYAEDSNGDRVLKMGNGNPHIEIDDGDGVQALMNSPNPEYEEWRRYTATIDWETNTWEFLWEDITGNTSDITYSGPLKENAGDIARIGVESDGDDIKTHIDQITKFDV